MVMMMTETDEQQDAEREFINALMSDDRDYITRLESLILEMICGSGRI